MNKTTFYLTAKAADKAETPKLMTPQNTPPRVRAADVEVTLTPPAEGVPVAVVPVKAPLTGDKLGQYINAATAMARAGTVVALELTE